MKHIKVNFVGGNYIETSFNGTDAEIREYYRVGSRMNVGRGPDDYFETVESVEIF